jgi:glutamate carboxypeptidase
LTNYERQTTLNVGVFHGGTVSNVVPEEAVAQVDVRIMQPGEWERIEAEMRVLRPVLDGTSLEITGGLNRPPMPFDESMQTTFEKARSIADTIGIELKAGGSGGGSDANFVAALGIPVLDAWAQGEGTQGIHLADICRNAPGFWHAAPKLVYVLSINNILT